MSPQPGSDAWLTGGDDPGRSYYGETPPARENENSLSPARLLYILRKRWLSVLLVTLFAGFAAAYYLSKADRVYQSKALFELITRRPRFTDKKAAVIEDPSVTAQSEETMNTQLMKMKSKSMLPLVIACYRQANPDDTTPEQELSWHLRGGASFALIRKTRLVTISYTDTDPLFAQRACQAYAEGTEANARSENRAASDAAVAWLETQTKAMQLELGKADQALFDARQACQMDVLESQRKTVAEALQSFNQSLVNIESEEALEKELSEILNALELTPENVGHLPAATSRTPEIEQTLTRWRLAVADHDALLTKYTASHPDVAARAAETTLYWGQAQEALRRARLTAAANLNVLHRQAESLSRMKDDQSRRAAELERDILDREMKLSALQRARDASDAACLGLMARIQDARLSADENTASVKVIEDAGPAFIISPRTRQIFLLALLLGVVGGLGLAFVTESLEDQVIEARELESESNLKVLAMIPHIKTRSRNEVATSVLKRSHYELTEAFAGLRSVLDSPSYKAHSKVILIASAMPEEGKTTTCCNLAVSCAQSGQKVLLIDFDLRRPRIASSFPMPAGSPGLLDHLANGKADPGNIPYASECPNLSIIGTRLIDNIHPSDLLNNPRVAELIAWARTAFDRIILDAPPLGIVSDALGLGSLADCVLVMARSDISRKKAVRLTADRFRDAGVTAIAAVMTDVNPARSLYHTYGPYNRYKKQYQAYHTAGEAARPDSLEKGQTQPGE